MKRNLKVLGLALVAVFALSAVVASAATAQSGVLTSTNKEKVTLTGADTGVKQNWFKAFENKVECPDSTYTGHAVKTFTQTVETTEKTGKDHEFLPHGATEVTVTPHYRQTQTPPNQNTANCDVEAGASTLSATVTMNGCDFEFYEFKTAGGGNGTYSFLADVVCPAGKTIEVHIYSSHTHSLQLCKVTIGSQEGLTGFHATNTANETVDLTGTSKNIKAKKSGLCGAGETEVAEYNLDVNVGAHNEGNLAEGITISD
ncbi:MAG TPA: hypothetical protein VFM94_01080 [Solirubrobacterales bacterium]|nr:hypothetical protein [Solirubrobacterales bacterium]